MSACTRFPDDAQVLRYVTSDLAEPELSAFEDHLFACDACLQRVERYQAAQAALASRDLPQGPVGVMVPFDDAPTPGRRRLWWLGAVAALFVLALGAVVWRPATPAPARVMATPDVPGGTDALAPPPVARGIDRLGIAALAMVTPPPYLPVTTRGGSDVAAFATAMDAYTRQDWTAASRGLAAIATPEAQFYKGIADLMRGEAADAIRAFEGTRDSGVQPYARESAFYLGKAALLRGDLAAARQQFVAAGASRATTAAQARRLVSALDELR
ncbi:hypothetical protein TBR22_A11470 [Luteitalea sp. TBR-22]|uniref:hypothetical protein n=1 Tax=Luteitalea sp. TBR-22 TaxID=2802971 RepID=UPI001AF41BF3|nr:hypothetical protein [Luteitalea sp. TBR-22]BCS31944.1 hypothetical protein TBR22_A11470 [Luteitalea sp. TBR-22]